jgi:GPH family glycoside/pentoside/hexuronide:cation symporter
MRKTPGSGEGQASFAIMASYGTGKFLAEFLTGGIASLVFKFYETEVKLPAALVALALILYSVWNAINDPIIGFFTSRPTRLTAKLGRRFPWILCGSMTCGLVFFFVFAPPAGFGPWALFAWFLVSICLYDALYSTWEVNYQSVFPDRFRTQAERSKAAGIGTVIGVLGVAAGSVVPTFIIHYGDPRSYLVNAVVFAAAAILLALLLIPGVRETPQMIERYMIQERERKEAPSFFKLLKEAFGVRNFMAFILLYSFYQVACLSMTASIHYVGDYILGKSTTLIFAGMLAGALAAVPIWLALIKKFKSHQRLITIATFCLAIFCVPLLFVKTYWGFVVAMFGWGLSFGGFWLLMTPAMADVIDEVVVKTGKRDDGVYLGFRAFFGRLAYAVQAIAFWAVHALTGFAQNPRSVQAQAGIRAHTAAIPAIFLLLGALVFIKMNTLNEAKVEENRRILAERSL